MGPRMGLGGVGVGGDGLVDGAEGRDGEGVVGGGGGSSGSSISPSKTPWAPKHDNPVIRRVTWDGGTRGVGMEEGGRRNEEGERRRERKGERSGVETVRVK